eukprot:364759-Chlamydomonas_euryale.AAC.3
MPLRVARGYDAVPGVGGGGECKRTAPAAGMRFGCGKCARASWPQDGVRNRSPKAPAAARFGGRGGGCGGGCNPAYQSAWAAARHRGCLLRGCPCGGSQLRGRRPRAIVCCALCGVRAEEEAGLKGIQDPYAWYGDRWPSRSARSGDTRYTCWRRRDSRKRSCPKAFACALPSGRPLQPVVFMQWVSYTGW